MSRNYEMLLALKDGQIVSSPRPVLVEDGPAPPAHLSRLEKNALFNLVQRLFVIPGPHTAPRSVLFCSVGEVCLCASLALQLAEALVASANSSVCLVDANFQSPSLHRLIGPLSRRSLAEALRSPSDVHSFVQQLSPSGVSFLTAGSVVPFPDTPLSEERLRPCLTELRSHFDRILMLAPPFGPHEDALWLGRLADGVVLVLEAGTTRRDLALRAKASFDAVGVKVLGAVLTEHKIPIPKTLDRFL